MSEARSNRNIVFSCRYHVVWCPKYRKHVISEDVAERLKDIILQVAVDTKTEVIEMACESDHVHILCSVDPQFGIHRFVKMAKGRSSRLLREEFPFIRSRLPSLWTNSYYVSTVGHVSLDRIREYIESQPRRRK